MILLFSGKDIDWVYTHRLDGREFQLDTSEIRKVIGDLHLTHPRVRRWLLDYLQQGEAELVGWKKTAESSGSRPVFRPAEEEGRRWPD